MGISSTFNVENLYEFHDDGEPLYLDYKLGSSSSEVEMTDVGQLTKQIKEKLDQKKQPLRDEKRRHDHEGQNCH